MEKTHNYRVEFYPFFGALEMRICVHKNGNYGLEIQSFKVGQWPITSDSFTRIPFTQQDVRTLLSMPTGSGPLNRYGLHIERKGEDTIVHYKDKMIYLNILDWNKILYYIRDLVENHNVMQKYYNSPTKQLQSAAGTDVNMLKHLTVVCTNLRVKALHYRLKKVLCEKHREYRQKFHQDGCSRVNRDTYCHALTKQAMGDINTKLLSKILKMNNYGAVKITMQQIIGDDYDLMIDRAHFDDPCTYLITQSHMFPEFPFCKNQKIVEKCNHIVECEVCNNKML